MIDSEPPTELLISEQARAEADALVDTWHLSGPDTDVRVSLARVLQVYMNRLELAELERQQAVAAANDLRRMWQQVRAAVDSVPVDRWAECPRCAARAPFVSALRHGPGCALSTAPPPPSPSLLPPITNTGGSKP